MLLLHYYTRFFSIMPIYVYVNGYVTWDMLGTGNFFFCREDKLALVAVVAHVWTLVTMVSVLRDCGFTNFNLWLTCYWSGTLGTLGARIAWLGSKSFLCVFSYLYMYSAVTFFVCFDFENKPNFISI